MHSLFLIGSPTVARCSGATSGNFPATLLAIAGHDLRQPLQIIRGAHDLLARALQSDKQRKELALAENATTRLALILDQLVDALHLHEQSDNHVRVPVQLRPVLSEAAGEFAEAARRKGICLRVTSARGTILSHPVLLAGMLRNLIRNAIDYTPSGGNVSIGCRRLGAELRITVRDDGVGIPADALCTLFTPFRRNDNSRPEGLGLGLFIAKQAGDLIGHRIEVRSTDGRGSCFTIVTNAEGGLARE